MKRFRLIVVFVCIAILLFATWCWFLPVGEGEYAHSPDGRYTASAGNCTRGTWLRGRISFIEIQIIEKSSGSVVWKSERYLRPNEVPSEFYNRSKKHIFWATDSRSVTIPVSNQTDSVWFVP